EQTGEPHAADTADAEDVQSFTYCFFIEHRPGERHVIDKPADYTRNRDGQPYTLTLHYGDGRVMTYGVFEHRPGTFGTFWSYRRAIDATQFDDPRYARDLALINWPGNDYRGGNILVDDPAEQLRQLQAARDLSLGFLHWMQTEMPRDDGGRGYPEFKLRPDVVGTPDGLCMFPYIRESRRIAAIKTIVEQEVTATGRQGPRAAHFDDSVGIGLYGIDIHESKRGRKQVIDPTKPFQVPLGALIPRRTANLLAGCKNIGTTHITNGCYRLHPIEWGIGEAAGLIASLCVERKLAPREVREQKPVLRELQRRIVARGSPIMWYDDVPTTDRRFEKVQILPFEQPAILERLDAGLHAP
ncbi:MAG TPA: FAD-dependent oxidoreductase, partial [Phycisphaerae bacterium]|nr:FAD-dependent oxidoreductase [Phycisphaerae bacterium]